MDHKTWLKLTETDPAAARQAHADGDVEFPDYMRDALAEPPASRPPQPTTVEGVQEQAQQAQERHSDALRQLQAPSDALKPGATEREPVELPDGTEPISQQRWHELSKRKPDEAMAYYRQGLVTFPDHVADSLEV